MNHNETPPMRRWRVEMVKRTCHNAVQNARKVIEYVDATNEAQALAVANAIPVRAPFKAMSARVA